MCGYLYKELKLKLLNIIKSVKMVGSSYLAQPISNRYDKGPKGELRRRY